MADREKVLKGLECCTKMSGYECQKCPYSDECLTDSPYGTSHLAADALALLKDQEEQLKRFELERSWDENPDRMGNW